MGPSSQEYNAIFYTLNDRGMKNKYGNKSPTALLERYGPLLVIGIHWFQKSPLPGYYSPA